MSAAEQSPPRVLIIGSGFSGLCLGIALRRAGIESFEILEKADRLGGTWRDNTYPGAACDLASFAYCFSFEQKADWSRKWSPQEEILEYMDHCADKYGLRPHLRLGCEVQDARFDEVESVWRVRTSDGEERVAEVLVSGVGQLHHPSTPSFEGLESFAGPSFHSARWDHGLDLHGKRVAVVGNAASAIQFIPQIAPQAAELRVFQRSANWMLPRNDRAYGSWEKRLYRWIPGLARLYRWRIWLRQELMYPVFLGNRRAQKAVRKAATEYMEQHIEDPDLKRALIPDYPPGGKRILIADDYYPALARPNVHVVTDDIERFVPEGIVTSDGKTHSADVVIFATGFATTSFLAPMKIAGRGSRTLDDAWADGARAYLGLTAAGFPNFFMMYGPNTNLGHNSIIFMIECQARYILECVRALQERQLASLDVKAEVMDAFDDTLQAELGRTVWARTEASWYKNRAGRITNNWSGTTTRYWWRTRHVDWDDFDCRPQRGASATERV